MIDKDSSESSKKYLNSLKRISLFSLGIFIFSLFGYASPVQANTLASCLRVTSAQFQQNPSSISYEVTLSSICDSVTTARLDGASVDLFFGNTRINLFPSYYYSRFSSGLVKFEIDSYTFKQFKPGVVIPKIEIGKIMPGQILAEKTSFVLPGIRAIDPIDCITISNTRVKTSKNAVNVDVTTKNSCLDNVGPEFFDYKLDLKIPGYKRVIPSQEMLLFPNVFDTLRNNFSFRVTGLKRGNYKSVKIQISPRYSLLDTPVYEKFKIFQVPRFTIK